MFCNLRRYALAFVAALALSATGARTPQPAQDAADKPAKAPQVPTDLYGDPLPAGAVARLGTIRFRRVTPHGVAGIAFVDSNTIVTACGHEIQFWDATTGRLLREVDAEPISVGGFALAADGKQFAVAGSRRGTSDKLGPRWPFYKSLGSRQAGSTDRVGEDKGAGQIVVGARQTTLDRIVAGVVFG